MSLPRSRPESLEAEFTWPEMLKKAMPQISLWQCAIGGATIKDLAKQVFYYKQYKADLVILQSGIVDCAPRTLTRMEAGRIAGLRFFRKQISKLVDNNKHLIRKIRLHQYTTPTQFLKLNRKIVADYKPVPLLAIGIAPARNSYEIAAPGIGKQIALYNSILEKVHTGNFISLEDLPLDGIMSDDIHLNEKGHAFVLQKITSIINSHL